jgi:tetratricopeptide (TPR) repeat protein
MESSSTVAAVLSLDSQTFLGHNQETYRDLRSALVLNLRRQLLIAVCDDVALQYQFAQRLTRDLRPGDHSHDERFPLRPDQSPMVTIQLDGYTPDLVRQVLLWLKQHRHLKGTPQTIPAFQILGVESLTRQSLTIQNRFLASLIRVDALLTQLDCRLLVWIPRPWLGKIQQSVPGFWRSRNALFEFVGEPTWLDDVGSSSAAIGWEHHPVGSGSAQPQESGQGIARTPPGNGRHLSPSPQPGPKSSNAKVNLRQVVEDDLTRFEAHTLGPTEADSTDAASPPPAPLATPDQVLGERHDAPEISSPDDGWHDPVAPFTIVGDATLSTVVMPPQRKTDASEFAWMESVGKADGAGDDSDGVAPSVTAPEPGGMGHPPGPDEVAPANVTAPVGQPPLVGAKLGRQRPPWPPPLDTPIPTALAEDAEISRLWGYIGSLIAQQAGPLTLSRAYLALGHVSRDRIAMNQPHPATLDFAVAAYHRAIDGMLAGETDWCDALNDLAGLYWLRAQLAPNVEARAEWLQPAIGYYQQAIAGAQASTPRDTLMRLYSNLGSAFSMMAEGQDAAATLTQSLRAYHQALQYTPMDQSPVDYANLQNIIGAVHWRLAQWEQPHYHLHGAITSYLEALRYHSPGAQSAKYAMLQNNLGIAYWSLAQHERPAALLQEAINAYQAALAYRTPSTDPAGCAATNNNLGTALWDLAQQQPQPEQRLETLRQAILAYEAALDAVEKALQQDPPPLLGFDIWATFHSAGVVHDHIAEALPPEQIQTRQHHLQQALGHYLLAHQGWQHQPSQVEVLITALVHNVQLHFDILGIAGQQAALSQVPGELLPVILQKLSQQTL